MTFLTNYTKCYIILSVLLYVYAVMGSLRLEASLAIKDKRPQPYGAD